MGHKGWATGSRAGSKIGVLISEMKGNLSLLVF